MTWLLGLFVLAALVMSIVALVLAVRKRGKCSSSSSSSCGSSSSSSNGGKLSSYVGFCNNDSNVIASTDGPVGSFMTSGVLSNLALDDATVANSGDFIAFIATHTGYFQRLHVYINPINEESTSVTSGQGSATIWKTSPCDTGFSPTDLTVSWDIPTGTDSTIHCVANNEDHVAVSPGDRFMLVFTASGGDETNFVSYSAPANAALEYVFKHSSSSSSSSSSS